MDIYPDTMNQTYRSKVNRLAEPRGSCMNKKSCRARWEVKGTRLEKPSLRSVDKK